MNARNTIFFAATLAALTSFAVAQDSKHDASWKQDHAQAQDEKAQDYAKTDADEDGKQDRAEPRFGDWMLDAEERETRSYPLDLRVWVFEPATLMLDAVPANGETGDIFIVVCMIEDSGLRPVALLDTNDPRQTVFAMELETFSRLPIALYAVRVAGDGKLEMSEVETAKELAEEATRVDE